MPILTLILGIVIGALFYGLVIYIVSRLNLGIQVNGYGVAFIAAIVIALIGWVLTWLLNLLGISIGGGLLGPIVLLILAALVLMFAGRLVKGLKVHGFTGAIIAAIAIAVLTWLINWILGLIF